MRGNRKLVAVLGTVLALVLAGGMIATGAVAQGENGSLGSGYDPAGGGSGYDPAGDEGAAPSGGVDSGGGGGAVTLASTGAPVAMFFIIGSVLLAAGLVRPGRRGKRS